MDQLKDLLECSVCLESMNVRHKVLPCQHTFCLRCLTDIKNNHNNVLRCPECRTLVTTELSQLPPNVLLMRILEITDKSSANSSEDQSESGEASSSCQLPEYEAGPKAMFKTFQAYSAGANGYLAYPKGAQIEVVKVVGWETILGQYGGHRGLVNASVGSFNQAGHLLVMEWKKKFVSSATGAVESAEPKAARCARAESTGRLEQSFADRKSSSISPARSSSVHNADRLLMEPRIPPAASALLSENSAEAYSRLEPLPVDRYRHLMPIAGPSLVHSSDRLPMEHRNPQAPLPPALFSDEDLRKRVSRSAGRSQNNVISGVSPQLPQPRRNSVEKYVALYPYKPQKRDELELVRGYVYVVSEKCIDGWFKGRQDFERREGMFPGNYVAPLDSLPAMASSQIRGMMQCSHNLLCADIRRRMTTSAAEAAGPSSLTDIVNLNDAAPSDSGNAPSLPPRSLTSLNTPGHHNPVNRVPPPRSGSSSGMGGINFKNFLQGGLKTKDNRKSKSTDQTKKVKNDKAGTRPSESEEEGGFTSDRESAVTVACGGSGNAARSGGNIVNRFTSKFKQSLPTPLALDNPVFEAGPSSYSPISHARSESCPSKFSYDSPKDALASAAKEATALKPDLQKIHSKHVLVKTDSPRRMAPSTSGQVRPKSEYPSGHSLQVPAAYHAKSASLDDQLSQAQGPSSHHTDYWSKVGSWVSNHKAGPSSSKKDDKLLDDTYRCLVPFPSSNDYELGLEVGDLVLVQKKREDGWYKGISMRTGRRGLFPSSFIEKVDKAAS